MYSGTTLPSNPAPIQCAIRGRPKPITQTVTPTMSVSAMRVPSMRTSRSASRRPDAPKRTTTGKSSPLNWLHICR